MLRLFYLVIMLTILTGCFPETYKSTSESTVSRYYYGNSIDEQIYLDQHAEAAALERTRAKRSHLEWENQLAQERLRRLEKDAQDTRLRESIARQQQEILVEQNRALVRQQATAQARERQIAEDRALAERLQAEEAVNLNN